MFSISAHSVLMRFVIFHSRIVRSPDHIRKMVKRAAIGRIHADLHYDLNLPISEKMRK
jgi:hypothetical protein